MLEQVAQVELAVQDLEASRAFYTEQLGLEEITCGSTSEVLDFCLLAVGPSILALYQAPAAISNDREEPAQPPVVDHFALLVDDLQATYDALKGRIPFLGEPSATAIGHRNMQRALLAFEDPDGLHVQISETIDPRPHIEARKAAKRHMSEAGGGHFGGFDHISTYCNEFEAARGFFGAQLGMEEFFHSTTREAGENVLDGFAQAAFAVGGTDIELATAPLDEPLTSGVIRRLSFCTADLDSAARHMDDGAFPFTGPEEWGAPPDAAGRALLIRSPDALDVRVVQRSPGSHK